MNTFLLFELSICYIVHNLPVISFLLLSVYSIINNKINNLVCSITSNTSKSADDTSTGLVIRSNLVVAGKYLQVIEVGHAVQHRKLLSSKCTKSYHTITIQDTYRRHYSHEKDFGVRVSSHLQLTLFKNVKSGRAKLTLKLVKTFLYYVVQSMPFSCDCIIKGWAVRSIESLDVLVRQN